MSRKPSGIVADGLMRLLRDRKFREEQKALESRIRARHAAALAAARDGSERKAIRKRIREEIRQSRPSPYCLWMRA